MASAWKPAIAILLLCIAAIPMTISAEQSGSIQASANTVALMPSAPEAGGSVTIYLTLSNTGNYADGVAYAFYRNGIGTNALIRSSTIDIDNDADVEVSAVWEGLVEGDHEVHITFEHPRNSGNQVQFWVEFTVTGLPNLKVTETHLSPSSGIFAGDAVTLSSLVRNLGSEPADASILHIDLPGANDLEIPTPSIAAGLTEWVNTTFSAPQSGSHTLMVTPDYQNAVHESSEYNKIVEVPFVVDTRMDLYHIGELIIEMETGALEGPWMVTGKIGRTNGTGTSVVPLWLQIATPSGGFITTAPFSVNLTGTSTGYAETEWSHEISSSNLDVLPASVYIVTAIIDPFGTASFIQESTSNDVATAQLSKYAVPDVFVDPNAIASSPSVNSGDSVVWSVGMRNTGEISVSGKLYYTWEGVDATSPIIHLDKGEYFTWSVELTTSIGAHDATFESQWGALTNSWDSNPTNSVASGVVSVEAELRLEWALATLIVTDSNGTLLQLPTMTQGDTYTLQIDLTSYETGNLTYDCLDESDTILTTIYSEVTILGQKVTLTCEFTASAPSTVVRLVPSDPTISTTFTRTFSTTMSAEDIEDLNSNSELGTFTLIGFGALALIGILAISIFLTRETEEEVERDIFEYCPSCDGELEGDENRCPSCSFNLKKARSQFHDCGECGESIPDLLDNCAYCGAEQDVSSYFEQRERKERVAKTVVALPEEVDEDAIVTGTENFAQTAKEFGFDEEELEDDWDTNILSAEAEVEAAYDRKNSEQILREEMTEEELEAYQNTVTPTLKSMTDLGHESNDIDSILASKGDIIAHKDDGKELSASDADIRGRLFEITGEQGTMPGEKVNVGMELTDSSFAGNEVSETTSDFSVIDDDTPIGIVDELSPQAAKPIRRRGTRRKAVEEQVSDVAECGACGADLPADASECGTCGAKFE